jgi:hypothetical protein
VAPLIYLEELAQSACCQSGQRFSEGETDQP